MAQCHCGAWVLLPCVGRAHQATAAAGAALRTLGGCMWGPPAVYCYCHIKPLAVAGRTGVLPLMMTEMAVAASQLNGAIILGTGGRLGSWQARPAFNDD